MIGSKWAQPQKKRFKVKTIRKDYNRSYYIIESEGVEHQIKMFEHQKTEDQPDEIDCLIKEGPEGPIITQDLVPIIAKRYKLGETYEFKLKASADRPGEFDALAQEGFLFRVVVNKQQHLRDRQHVRGRVTKISGVKVDVSVEGEETVTEEKSEEADYVTPAQIGEMAEAIGLTESSEAKAGELFMSDSSFAEARKSLTSGARDWLQETLKVICEEMPRFLQNEYADSQQEMLDQTRRLGIELLEKSELLRGAGNEQERAMIAETIRTTDTYKMALAQLAEKSGETYACEMLASLGRTGYLYEPERRMRTLMAMFSMDEELKRRHMPELINTLSAGDSGNWEQEPLKGAIVWMLSAYTRHEREETDNIMDIELGDNKTKVTLMVKALAMLLLLTEDDESGSVNRHLQMARLCRYAALLSPGTSQQLTDKAYGYLFGRMPAKLNFGWSDLTSNNVGVVCYKLQGVGTQTGPEDSVVYNGRQAYITVLGNTITVGPAHGWSLHNAIPAGMMPWKNMRALVVGKDIDRDIRPTEKDTRVFYRLWRNISDNIFAPGRDIQAAAGAEPRRQKSQEALRGDRVTIRVTGREGRSDQSGNPLFHCVIEDEELTGEGYISPRDIVHYNVMDASINDFRSGAGQPLLLEATVESVESDGACHFTMRSQIDRAIHEMAVIGDQLLCKMTIRTPNGDSLLISEKGYSVKMPDTEQTPTLTNGEVVWVEITDVHADGKVDVEYLDYSDNPEEMAYMADHMCMRTLLRDYASGVYEGDEDEDEELDNEQRQAQNEMERDEAYELMTIVDRQSQLTASRQTAYNYLGMASLMATAIEETAKAEEYGERMHLIDMTQQYAINRTIDAEEFERYYLKSGEILAGNPDLNDKATRLLCISLLNKAGSHETLLSKARRHAGTTTGEIAELVLAHNIASSQDLKMAARQIMDKINEKMNIAFADETRLEYIGEESPTLEFKTSLVYPPGNGMKADKRQQATNIMIRLCGMMNEKGGRLMIGVNDQGYASGIDADLTYFADGQSEYDEQKSRDKMDLFFRDMMLKVMSREANDYLETRFEVHGEKTVYVIETQPSGGVMSADGRHYRRYGTTTREMSDEEVTRMATERKSKEARSNKTEGGR